MKIQYIAVIFIIIMIPIVLVLTIYTQSQIDNLALQLQYDTYLYDAAHDGMKAFQLNTVNNKYSQVADSLKRDVEAAIKTFINSLSDNLSLGGYTTQDISPYIPAVLFTLYDGYYIYAPTYAEKLEEVDKEVTGVDGTTITITVAQSKDEPEYSYENILKPYIYYTVRYNSNENNDFMVNYTLDNYISLYGTVNGKYVTKSGFLIVPDENIISIGIDKLKLETILKRHILEAILPLGELEGKNQQEILDLYNAQTDIINAIEPYKDNLINDFGEELLTRILENGTLENVNTSVILQEITDTKIDASLRDVFGTEKKDFTIEDNEGNVIDEVIDVFDITYKGIKIDDSDAKKYYAKALRFSNWVNDNLSTIKASDAKQLDGTAYEEFKNNNTRIFNTKVAQGNDPEDLGSAFSQHRMTAIQVSIQTNLNAAIAKYNERFFKEKTYSLKMPVINYNEWEKITNNVSMATFFQGVQIGNKIYNNYAVVGSNENKEMILVDNIYYFKKDLEGKVEYHKIDCPRLDDTGEILGAKNIDYDIYKTRNEDETYTYTFGDTIEDIRQEGRVTELSACYECIVNQNYIPISTLNENRLKAKYTAIAKERNNLYKMNAYINM